MPLSWRITSITGGVDFDRAANQFVQAKIVQFMVGKHGPFQITLRADEFTTERATQLLNAEADQISRLFPEG